MNKSFTLIEILVVIVVIGVLSAFILVGMSSITSSANIAKGKAFANSLRNSLLVNLVSEWKMDGNANDSWGANNGIITGHEPDVISGLSCISGSCFDFTGATDYIEVSDNDNLTMINYLTIEMWVKLKVNNETLTFINKNSEYTIGITSSGLLRTDTGAGGSYSWQTTDDYIETDKWTHISLLWDGSLIKLYKNGLFVHQFTDAGAISNTTNNLFIGAYSGTGLYKGSIDDVRIYNQVITIKNIKQDYYLGINQLFIHQLSDKMEYIQRISDINN